MLITGWGLLTSHHLALNLRPQINNWEMGLKVAETLGWPSSP